MALFAPSPRTIHTLSIPTSHYKHSIPNPSKTKEEENRLTHGHRVSGITQQHSPGLLVRLLLLHPVFDFDGDHVGIVGQIVDQRSEWFGPVSCEGLHQGNALFGPGRDANPSVVGPGDDNLAEVSVRAVIEVEGTVEDCRLDY